MVRWFESPHAPGTTVADGARRIGRHLAGAVRPALLVAGGMLGAAVSAFQVLPFLERLGVYDIGYRSAQDRAGSDAFTLLAVAVPAAYGRAA